ncbi:MAG: tripartite tricarboxylate transporter TctB family protein [Geminicoccaceae bacterium]
MRAGFIAAILGLAVLYTYWAFVDLSFLSSTGRLGPGFFPRIVGLILIGVCLLTLAGDLSLKERHGGALSSYWRTTVLVAGLSGAFVLLLEILGGPLAMIVYLLATLSVLNRGRVLQNVAVGVGLPIALFLLFDVWLNASVPPDALGLPW